jgi:serine/threonine protein kinase
MELGTGSIDEVIEQGEWSAERLIMAFGAMCRAVQRLHNQGIAHRDLKPDNFLVMKDGSVKLADFGTARFLNESPLEIDYQGWPGDKRHTAPEMFALLHDHEPEIAKVADIFSLGTILFELFTRAKVGLLLYDQTFGRDMAGAMSQVRGDERRRMLNQLLPSITDARPLPSISDFGQPVPAIISDRLDRLYRAMTSLDYRQRQRDFTSIFREIERCLFLLRRQREYGRLRELRARRGGKRSTHTTPQPQRGTKS